MQPGPMAVDSSPTRSTRALATQTSSQKTARRDGYLIPHEPPESYDVIAQSAERAGFEVLDVESLRPHYALTCAAWVANLTAHRNACLALVDGPTYRTWLLYLAASAVSFERRQTELYQTLLAKRSAGACRRLTRKYMYMEPPTDLRSGSR